MEFGLSSRLRAYGASAGDRLANCELSIIKSQSPNPKTQTPTTTAWGLELGIWDFPLAVYLLLDSVLFELLVEITSRRIQRFGGLRNVPVVLAELLDEEGAFGSLLELS